MFPIWIGLGYILGVATGRTMRGGDYERGYSAKGREVSQALERFVEKHRLAKVIFVNEGGDNIECTTEEIFSQINQTSRR